MEFKNRQNTYAEDEYNDHGGIQGKCCESVTDLQKNDEIYYNELGKPCRFYETSYNGILSPDDPYIYYFGIIDNLTKFTFKKKMESFFKRIFQKNPSCIPPDYYGDRFIDFMQDIIASPKQKKPLTYWKTYKIGRSRSRTPARKGKSYLK